MVNQTTSRKKTNDVSITVCSNNELKHLKVHGYMRLTAGRARIEGVQAYTKYTLLRLIFF